MDTKEEIQQNLKTIQERIDLACKKAGRSPDDVKLLLATKTVPAERVKIALNAGYTLIAENKMQEVKEKYDCLKDIPHISHFIGHLQSNKIKEVLRYPISCIQSIDRFELAEKLNQRLLLEGKTMAILIQVNTSGEESKFGVHPDKALELVRQVAELSQLQIKGLMTIGLLSSESTEVRKCFQLLKQVQQNIMEAEIAHVQMDELSMGMSGDLEIAIEEGATIVRVGTAIFGQRPTPDSYYWNEQTVNQIPLQA